MHHVIDKFVKNTYTHNYILLKYWMNASFNTQVMLKKSKKTNQVLAL